MNRPAILIAAALAVALIPVTASAATTRQPAPDRAKLTSDVVYSGPHIAVVQQSPPLLNLVQFSFKATEDVRPDEFKVTIELFRWLPTVYEADVIGRELKNIRDLPGVGNAVIWRLGRQCKPGRYYAEATTTGISHTGHYQRDEAFYPAGRRKVKAGNRLGWKWVPDGARAPDRKHSIRIKAC